MFWKLNPKLGICNVKFRTWQSLFRRNGQPNLSTPELRLDKANTSDTEVPFLDLHLLISNGVVSSKIYDKRDDLDFDRVNFPFLDRDVPHRPSYGVYISQLIRFARVCSHVDDFNTRNRCLTAKLLKQGYLYHKLRKATQWTDFKVQCRLKISSTTRHIGTWILRWLSIQIKID